MKNVAGSPNNSFKRCKARTAGTIVDITDAGKYGSAVPQKAETSTLVDKSIVEGSCRTLSPGTKEQAPFHRLSQHSSSSLTPTFISAVPPCISPLLHRSREPSPPNTRGHRKKSSTAQNREHIDEGKPGRMKAKRKKRKGEGGGASGTPISSGGRS
uniref:Uncharacterized protein n=1 Tax=Brassica campestris TaxID=3711 RepID=M4DML3_BRACM